MPILHIFIFDLGATYGFPQVPRLGGAPFPFVRCAVGTRETHCFAFGRCTLIFLFIRHSHPPYFYLCVIAGKKHFRHR